MSAPISHSCSANALDDFTLSEASRNSPSGSVNGMDVDMAPPPPAVPLPANISPVPWRQTPPPIASVSRPNKRKHEDRYDPYASSVKRRAVSPSITALRDSLSHAIGAPGCYSASSSTSSIPIPRSPIVRSRDSMSMSVTSSPGTLAYNHLSHSHSNSLSHSYTHSHIHSHSHNIPIPIGFIPMSGTLSRPLSGFNSPLSSSPQQRPVGLLASPILRPIPRMASSSNDRGQKEIDGTGQAVSSLSLG